MRASLSGRSTHIGPGTGGKPSIEKILRRASPILLLALLAAIALVYWPGLNGGYVFDDFPNIVDNSALHVTHPVWNEWLAAIFSSPSSSIQRPLAMLSFAINHYFTGLDPRPMKLTNIAIHSLNAILVLGLVLSVLGAAARLYGNRYRQSGSAAWFATGFWALHPINLMAVLFIVQRMESLSHTFVFAGLWLYVCGRRRQLDGLPGWRWIFFALIACTALGLLVKESAALLPVYTLCLELCLFHFRTARMHRDRRLLVLYALLLVLPASIGLAWLLPKALDPASFASRDFTLGERLLTEPRVVLDYLHWILLPDLNHLSLYHDDYLPSRGLWNPPSTVLGLIAIPVLLATAWWCRRRRPLMSLGLLWFLGAQLLTATIIPLELVFEHRNYFASLGIGLVLADLLLLAPANRTSRYAGAAIAAALLMFLAAITCLRASEWNHPVRFTATEAAKHPQSPRATYDLARTLVVLSNYDVHSPLIGDAFKALERARQVPHGNILPDQATLIFAARIGAPIQPAWWEDMQAKLRRNPIGPQQLSALGALTDCTLERHCRFPREDMLATFAAALSHGPHAEILSIYGNYALNELGDAGLALRLWQEAVALRPNEPQYRISLAKLMIALGRDDQARMQIAQLRKLGRLGQYRAVADSLEERMKNSMRERIPRDAKYIYD